MTDLYLGYPDENITNWIKENCVDYTKLPFYFEALEDGNIKLVSNVSSVSPSNYLSFVYSFDNKTWQDWDCDNGTNVISGQKLYLKAKTTNSTFSISYENYVYNCFNVSMKTNVAGNIMSLLYNDFIDKKELSSIGTFYNLFNNCTGLLDASKLILPATTLTNGCYQNMFNLCNFLKYAPELPATILADYCYSCMFSGCYYLKYAPALPATILANYCYQNMFDSCSALTQIPELPATELKDCCYVYMFNSCYDLAGSISLPNLNLDLMNAFCFMFNYCTSITELHYPKSFADNETFANIPSAPWLGATNAIIYYDL